MNLRPSGYEPDELPGCSIPRRLALCFITGPFCPKDLIWGFCFYRFERFPFLTRFGGDLLSHVLRRSTIGAVALNCRVREGIGCFAHAMTTKPRKKRFPEFSGINTISDLALRAIPLFLVLTLPSHCDVVMFAFEFMSDAFVYF